MVIGRKREGAYGVLTDVGRVGGDGVKGVMMVDRFSVELKKGDDGEEG